MSLQALRIVEEEIQRIRAAYGVPNLDCLDRQAIAIEDATDKLLERIKQRIEKECIEQPDPEEDPNPFSRVYTNWKDGKDILHEQVLEDSITGFYCDLCGRMHDARPTCEDRAEKWANREPVD